MFFGGCQNEGTQSTEQIKVGYKLEKKSWGSQSKVKEKANALSSTQ
jgi:hypothetical protein